MKFNMEKIILIYLVIFLGSCSQEYESEGKLSDNIECDDSVNSITDDISKEMKDFRKRNINKITDIQISKLSQFKELNYDKMIEVFGLPVNAIEAGGKYCCIYIDENNHYWFYLNNYTTDKLNFSEVVLRVRKMPQGDIIWENKSLTKEEK